MALDITFTDAGIAEIVNAENTGTAPVLITQIGVGAGQYVPDPSQTTLQNEIKRLTTFGGDVVSADTIHLVIRDDTADVYDLYEFGLFTDSGTLLAVYSQSGSPILSKTATTILLLATDILISAFDATSVTFGNTDFLNPPATTTVQGVVELATDSETQAGTDTERAVTPASLSSRTATETRTGLAELANQTEGNAGIDAQRIMTPARVKGYVEQFGLGKTNGNIYSAALNDLRAAGFYYADGSATNKPDSNNGYVIVQSYDAEYTSQIFIRSTDNKLYHRIENNGAWTVWQEILHTNNTYGVGQYLEIADADLAVNSGFYSLTVSLGAANSPEPGVSGTLNVVKGGSDSTYISQIWMASNDTDAQAVYTRHKKAAGWSSWRHIGAQDFRIPVSGGVTLEPYTQYHIIDSLSYTLPDASALAAGATVVITKSIFVAPTIETFGAEEIATDGGNVTSLELSSDSETIFVWNTVRWERVAVDDANGFSQSFSANGWQELPSGLIIQWGVLSGSTENLTTSYPITFPNSVFRRNVTLLDKNGGVSAGLTLYSLASLNSNSQIGARLAGYDSGEWTANYIAVGR